MIEELYNMMIPIMVFVMISMIGIIGFFIKRFFDKVDRVISQNEIITSQIAEMQAVQENYISRFNQNAEEIHILWKEFNEFRIEHEKLKAMINNGK
jgi:hypothetical protein